MYLILCIVASSWGVCSPGLGIECAADKFRASSGKARGRRQKAEEGEDRIHRIHPLHTDYRVSQLTACLATRWPLCHSQPGLSSPASTTGDGRTRLLQAALDAAQRVQGRQCRLPIGRRVQECAVALRCLGVGHPMVALCLFLQGTTRDARHRNRGCMYGEEEIGKGSRCLDAPMRDALETLSGGKRASFRVGPRQTRCSG